MSAPMRVGVINAGWPIQTLIRELVNGLAGQGHHVHLIATDQDDEGFVRLDAFSGQLELVPVPRLFGKLERRLRRLLGTALPGWIGINPLTVRRRIGRALARQARHDLLIGVEKAGLELAAWWGARAGIPYVYYSLELYVADHPGWSRFGWQCHVERACHARASGTIIQDRHRFEVLRAANGIAEQPVYFLPVGGAGAAPDARPAPRVLPSGRPATLLSLGIQGPGRYTQELIAAAATLPAGLGLVLHGPVYDARTRRLAQSALPPNVRFTTEVVPEPELAHLLANADIGLALYRCDNANDRLTAYSSQKVALYLRAALPIISFRNDAYADLFSRFRCGEMVGEVSEVGAAARRILDDYSTYSAAAQSAFAAIYRLDRYWEGLSRFLQTCAAPAQPAGVS
jgi:glycosyltransferase involved in cell wall biosynthesis